MGYFAAHHFNAYHFSSGHFSVTSIENVVSTGTGKKRKKAIRLPPEKELKPKIRGKIFFATISQEPNSELYSKPYYISIISSSIASVSHFTLEQSYIIARFVKAFFSRVVKRVFVHDLINLIHIEKSEIITSIKKNEYKAEIRIINDTEALKFFGIPTF